MRRYLTYLRMLGISGVVQGSYAMLTRSIHLAEVTRADCRYPMYLRFPTSDFPTYKQVFLDEEYRFLAQRPPEVIVDAGANIGLASIYFTNRYPNATIVAVEPEKSNFEMLLRNTKAYPNILPLQAALWGRNEEIRLVDPGYGKWGFMTESGHPNPNGTANKLQTVTALTVEKLMCDFGLQCIDILKVDIEGAEKEVFADTSKWIDRVGSVIVETHDHMKPGCSQSVHSGTQGFNHEWRRGENLYLSREHRIREQPV